LDHSSGKEENARMKSMGIEKLIMIAIVVGVLGFFIGYAVTYDENATDDKASPVAVAKGDIKPIDIKPVRELMESPMKGATTPKVIIQEISEFQ
jgi:cytoskeletal protein RodZ